MNKIMLIGNIATEPLAKDNYARIRVAVNNHFVHNGEKKTATEFFNAVGFGNMVKRMSGMCKIGTKVYLEGKLQSRKYTDSNNINRTSWSVIISNFQVLKDGESLEREEEFAQHFDNDPDPYDVRVPDNL